MCVAYERLTPIYHMANSWQRISQRIGLVACYHFDKYHNFEVNNEQFKGSENERRHSFQ